MGVQQLKWRKSGMWYSFQEVKKTKDRVDSVNPDEVAHEKPPHQDLSCLQIWLFS